MTRFKYITTVRLIAGLIILLIFSCENREWDNPFDPDCPKELFTPANFTAKQEENLVKLTWTQSNTQISGFVIDRSIDGGASWASVATPSKTELNWSDSNITGGKEHKYRLFAKAGSNLSNEVTTQVTPVFAPSLTTKAFTKLLSTTAVLGGEITSDGGSPVTVRGVCWGTSPNPTIINSKTTDGTGTGAFTSTITGLNTVTTYYVRAYATTSIGTSYGNEISFKTFFGEVTDVEGNVYPTVKIGEQVWMVENLKTTKYNDGTAIPNVTDNSAWAGLTSGGYCWCNNDINFKNTYGALYNWHAVNTNKLAPVGWHVPTDAEWTTLENFLGGAVGAGGKMKTLNVWISPNKGATNSSGFSALPGGYRHYDGPFNADPSNGNWWSSTESGTNTAWYRYLMYNSSDVNHNIGNMAYGISVRCILGENPDPIIILPTVSTNNITEYTSTNAILGGNVTSDGNTTVTERGVVYATTQNPTTSNAKVAIGTGTGSFSNTVSGLTANTTYYVRSYAINSQGTAYGAQESFTTSQSVSLATVTTTAVTTFTTTTAVFGGNVTSDGNATVTERGVVYATTQNPTTANTKVTIGTGTGSFNNTVSGLTANTTYYVRAYAINSQGTSYGSQESFTTSQSDSMATVTTNDVTTFTATTAILGGNVTNDGNATVTERGVVYATTQSPTTANTKVVIGSGTGAFSNTVSGLTANTTYYVRSYAINSQGTAYGSEVSFKTRQTLTLATITTTAVTTFTTTTAVLGGNVTSDGNASVTERGVVYATIQNPTTANTKVAIGSGTGSFSNTVSGLTANTTYYVRAYAINSQGTAYGAQESFITSQSVSLATVTTTAVTTFTTTTAVLGGNVTSDGNSTVTERGVVYATTQTPTTANTKVTIGNGTGIFSNMVSGLTANTTYYVRAFATNSQGTAYGEQISFATTGSNFGTFVDSRDAKEYKWVKIGEQVWMGENLAYLPNVSPPSAVSYYDPYYYVYDYNGSSTATAKSSFNYSTFGVLYNWSSALISCPTGWHLPNNSEWSLLSDYLVNNGYGFEGSGNDIAKSMAAKTNWETSPSPGTPGNDLSINNSSYFSGLPGGFSTDDGSFTRIGEGAYWWSSTEYSSSGAWSSYLYFGYTDFGQGSSGKADGYSVRCIKD